jgi:hypothetical protein
VWERSSARFFKVLNHRSKQPGHNHHSFSGEVAQNAPAKLFHLVGQHNKLKAEPPQL